MRVGQVILAVSVTLLAISDGITSASMMGVKVPANDAVASEKIPSLMTFDENNLNQDVAIAKLIGISDKEEERAGTAGAGAAARAAAGDNTAFQDRTTGDGKQVTVTKYHNNGLVQRFKRWWNRTFKSESKPSSKTQRQETSSKTQRLESSSKTQRLRQDIRRET